MNNYFIVIDKRDFKKIKTSLVHGNRYSDQKNLGIFNER